jgi:hypothetical protein
MPAPKQPLPHQPDYERQERIALMMDSGMTAEEAERKLAAWEEADRRKGEQQRLW